MSRSDVSDTSLTRRGRPKKAPRALSLPQLRQLRAALTYDDHAIARDLPDPVSFLMATGLRTGEACGLSWDLEAGAIAARSRGRRGWNDWIAAEPSSNVT
jgi:integrase